MIAQAPAIPAVLPDALMSPAAYPHRPAGVEIRETHISWVFLAGETAYKVKKPVRFPFLDYGTLARRRTCCAEEVRINRRFAPGVYAGVVALVPRGPDGLAIAHEADPRAVEYAIEMRRYDEDATLAARLPRGEAAPGDLAAVGRVIAGFHAAAERSGAGVALEAVVEETVATLGTVAPPDSRGRLASLGRFCRAALAGFGPELERREARGLVRDGHGDLRAEHVVGDRIEAVDGVEFDPGLRIADVAYDLAFLVMDVARRDDALARDLVRGYRAAGGDPGGEPLLAFLCAVRALVRAKIDFLRAAQLTGSAAAERTRRARELLDLADAFAWRARLPRVVCVTRLMASGKSTFAEALGAASRREVISSDRVRKLRAGVGFHEHAPPSAYTDAASRAVYAELGARAAAAARRDGGVIVDATFRRPPDAAAFGAASPALADAAWVVCDAPPEVLLERARRRQPESISDAGPEVVARELAVFHRAPDPTTPPLARLDTTRPTGRLLGELAAVLDARLLDHPT